MIEKRLRDWAGPLVSDGPVRFSVFGRRDSVNLLGGFGGKDFQFADRGRPREQFGGPGHKRCSDLAVQVSFASRLVVEHIDNRVHSATQRQPVPGLGPRSGFDEWSRAF